MLFHFRVMRELGNHTDTLFVGNPGSTWNGAVHADGPGCNHDVAGPWVAISMEGALEAVMFGSLPGRPQTGPNAEHWAVEKVAQVARESITVMIGSTRR